ncbi:MAG: glycosyltransferase 87 family protein [Mycobacterium sp.]
MTFLTLAAIALLWAGYVAVQLYTVDGGDYKFIDVLVYRAGGHAVLHHVSMYSGNFADVNQSPNGLPFTYPPFSGLVFVPFALLPTAVDKAIMVVLNAGSSAVFFVLVVVAVRGRWQRLRSWSEFTAPISARSGAVIVLAATLFVGSAPVRENFNHGQVNLILAAMVALDILLPRVRWPRGVLVGLAVAIKLTPAVFIGYFLVTRQWRAFAVALVTTAATFLVAWLVIPADTIRYFRDVVTDADRIGGLAYASNQSIRGTLERFPAVVSMRDVLWVVGVAVVLALAIVAIRVGIRADDPVAALLAAAFIGLLCSPVSWGHHWIWLSATGAYFLVRWAADGGGANLAIGLWVGVLTVIAPWTFLPKQEDRELQWSAVQHLLGDLWPITTLLLLIIFAAGRDFSSRR